MRTVRFSPGERNVFFHLLTGCNLKCSHCYINPEQHGSKTLELNVILSWLQCFARSGQATNLILLGGEPTLHPDLAEIIRRAKGMNYHVTVDSNGFLFHDFLKKANPSELDYLSFSLDGPNAEVNDLIRGQGVFTTCTENLKKAVRLGFKTSLIYTVSGMNIDHLHRMPELVSELGVDRFFIQVIGLRGKSAGSVPSSQTSWQVDSRQWLNIVPEVVARAAELGISVTWPKVYLDPDEPFQCAGLLAENYFVFPNGRVYQCPLCEDYPIHSFKMKNNRLVGRKGLNEDKFFNLEIAEGCVMNKLLQPDNIVYLEDGRPANRISCCLLKHRVELS